MLAYLGTPVVIAEDDAGRADFTRKFPLAAEESGPGWVLARWPDGKVYRHWRDQLRASTSNQESSR